MAVKEGELTPKQANFVEEYLIDLNATQAAIRAGYSEKAAAVIGFENLRKQKIHEKIQSRRKEIQESLQITQERILEEEARLAFVDVGALFDDDGELLPINKIPEDARRAIAGIEVTDRVVLGENRKDTRIRDIKRRYKLSDKGQALGRISKHLGLYAARKVEHTGKDGGPIETKITDFPKEPATIKEWEQQRKEAEESRNNEGEDEEAKT